MPSRTRRSVQTSSIVLAWYVLPPSSAVFPAPLCGTFEPPACHADALWLVLLQHARSGPRKRKRTAIEAQLAAQFGAGLSRYLVGKMSWWEARLQVAQLLRQLKDMRNRVLDYAELAEQLCCACGHHLALHGWQVIPPASACLTVRLPLGQRCHVSRASDERMDERCRGGQLGAARQSGLPRLQGCEGRPGARQALL